MKYTLLLTFLLFSVFVGAQNFKPAVKLSPGKKYAVVNSGVGNMTQEAMGQSMDIPLNATTTSLLEVKNAIPNGYEMSNTNERFQMSISMMGQDMNYDSDKKEDRDGQMGKEFNNLIGKVGLFTINNWGLMINSTASPEGVSKSTQSSANPIMSMVSLSQDATSTPALNLFKTDAILKIGQSFTDSTVLDNNKNICVYTLTEVSNGNAIFSILCDGTASVTQETQGMQVVSNITTKATGQMLVSTETGLLVKKTLVSTISGTVEAGGMTIPMSGTMSNTITVTEQQ